MPADPDIAVVVARLQALIEQSEERWREHKDRADERWAANREHNDARWNAHRDAHAVLASALSEYKRESNEWRATLADLRGTFVSDAEWKAEHRALMARMEAAEKLIASQQTESMATRSLFTNGRNLILLAVAVIGLALTVVNVLEH